MVHDDIVTPINPDRLEELLRATNYNRAKAQFVLGGLRHGFDIGYRGPQIRKDTAANIPIRVGSPLDMWNKVMTEVSMGRYAGPYTYIADKIPFTSSV